MKIDKIKISNFRLLKDFSIDLEDVLSLAIGKNNCGKTSFLSLLERFLYHNESSRFTFDDLNIESQQQLKQAVNSNDETEFDLPYGIFLKLYIGYNEADDLSNISSIMLDLNPDIKVAILSFEYSLTREYFDKLKTDFFTFKDKIISDLEKKLEEQKVEKDKHAALLGQALKKKDIIYFLKKYHADYFKTTIKALEVNNEANSIDITKEKSLLDKIISFKRIKAKRDVANQDGMSRESDKTLSKLSSKYYEKIVNAESESENISQLQNELSETDDKLNIVYNGLFETVIKKIKKFGGIKEDESKLMVISSLEERNLLANNTTVMYEHSNDHCLPEDYNGLGYMNLIAMIFEIEVLLSDFKKTNSKSEVPSDINLIFIEEPEAHTHPQLQCIFIKNIKTILEDERNGKDDGIKFNLQSIITTHSSQITAESNFDDIKYFFREGTNTVIAKNLKDLQEEYKLADPKDYQFLKQYLTLNRAELFFADKAVFIEGDTERLLLPAMMKKADLENSDPNCHPLLSQNISIIEVGAYSHIFEKFIDFLGIKTLIITDFDTCKSVVQTNGDGSPKLNLDGTERKVNEKCKVSEGTDITNSALKFFFHGTDFSNLKTQLIEHKKLSKSDTNGTRSWANDNEGNLCIVYQIEEGTYHARSFEDAFISLNLAFIKNNKSGFRSLKRIDDLDDPNYDAYDLADKCIDKKTLFALDILFFSDENLSNWQTPAYIKEGLSWLRN